jgi:hypothetical protein
MADGSLSQFKATLARKKARDDKRRGKIDGSSYKISDSKPEYGFPKLTDSELENVKIDIRKKIKAEKRKELILFGIILLILISIILYLI